MSDRSAPLVRRSLVALVGVALGELPAAASPPDSSSDGPRLIAREQDGDRLDLYFEDDGRPWSEVALEDVVRGALADADDAGLGISAVVPWVMRAGWVPAAATLVIPPVPRRPWEPPAASFEPAGPSVAKALVSAPGRRRRGALTGKVVYVSAGHGFTWDPDLGRWTTQRGNTHDIVEDLVSAETVDQLLTTYLENAGATVFTVRERDLNDTFVIVDADTVGASRTEGDGSYEESGAWADSTSGGYRAGLAPYVEDENPFALGASRVAPTSGDADTADRSATWRFTVAAPGDYEVYAAWVAGANRAPDAHYVIQHDGGATTVVVDQRHHGGTWVSLGRYYYAAAGAVTLDNRSATLPGTYVNADAIRVGGGMGDAARGTPGDPPASFISGRPRWEENARYHIQFSGAPASVYRYTSDERSDDVGARSRYAAWQNEVGEDALYVAWHTNAPDPGTGTSTYVYGPNPPDGSYDFTGAAGSDVFGRLLHDEVVHDLRAAIDPGWRDRGLYSAYFGEINPRHNDEMPSALVEVAFHSTASDATFLKMPRMRAVAARAISQAIVRYFTERDGLATHLSPDPPEAASATAIGPGRARIAWRAADVDGVGGDAATGYRLYRSGDGRAWDDGVDVLGTSADVDVASGAPSFFRVTAWNEGGESLPGTVVAVLPPCDDAARPALLVAGFERLDAGLMPRDDLSAWDLGSVLRMRLSQMNRFDGLVAHAFALAHAGLAFDSAEASAAPALEGHDLVVWQLGEESTADETFTRAEEERVLAWLGPGRTLIASGAELAWDLDAQGDAADRAFLSRLGAAYVADDAGTYALSWAAADAGALTLDDGTRGAYDVQYPDVLAPVGDAQPILSYEGGAVAGVKAGTASEGTSIVLGVPLEALFPDAAREAFVAALVAGASAARGDGCGAPADDGPEPIEPVEVVEPVEVAETVEGADGDDTVAGADGEIIEGAHAGRPSRAVSVHERGGDGCAGGDVSGLGLALVSALMFARRRQAESSGGAR